MDTTVSRDQLRERFGTTRAFSIPVVNSSRAPGVPVLINLRAAGGGS
jgi:hypothetical protein